MVVKVAEQALSSATALLHDRQRNEPRRAVRPGAGPIVTEGQRMRKRMLASAVAVAGMGMALTAQPTQAVQKDRHCVVNVSTGAQSCYTSFTDAVAKATGGRVTDAPDDSRAAMSDSRLLNRLNARPTTKAGTGAAALAPISIMYKDADFRGDSLIYQGEFDCSPTLTDINYTVELIRADFNDEIGSYRAFRGCRLSLFEHRGWAGGLIGFAGDRTDLGILDDKASSIRWS
ncbi:hypothetical protein ACFC7A_21120 [Streptomyces niveus]|uniref:hypothetical protein n=1 Tax=Streptomyces niveus TaxID=193462 RepID=UPI0035D5D4DF